MATGIDEKLGFWPLVTKLTLAVAICATVLVFGPECSPREVRIDISERGVGYILHSCDPSNCATDCCTLDAGTKPVDYGQQVQVSLLLATYEEGAKSVQEITIEARSPCMTLVGVCVPEGSTQAQWKECLAMQLNHLLDTGIADGLGFDGLDDANDVAVIMTFHNSDDGAGGGSGNSTGQCLADDLFACAGLTEVSEDVFDITCASCRKGPPSAYQQESPFVPPCVGRCFVQECYSLLKGVEAGL